MGPRSKSWTLAATALVLSYVSALDAYLPIGGPVSRQRAEFNLWLWSGERGAPALRVTVPGLRGLERAEGVCPAAIDGARRVIIVSDDGDRKAGRFAGYLLLDPAELQIAA